MNTIVGVACKDNYVLGDVEEKVTTVKNLDAALLSILEMVYVRNGKLIRLTSREEWVMVVLQGLFYDGNDTFYESTGLNGKVRSPSLS